MHAKFETKDSYRLGQWVSHCRTSYKKGKLSQEWIEALESLGFIWDLLEQDFQEGLSRLAAYKAEHGDVEVPGLFKTKDGYNLGSWVSERRKAYKKGKLPQARIDALDAFGFIWDATKK